MEQKRTVWILIAAGVFLCVVVGAAFIMNGSAAKRNVMAVSLKDSGAVWIAPSSSVLDTVVTDTRNQEKYEPLPVNEDVLAVTPTQESVKSEVSPVESSVGSITSTGPVTVYSTGSTNVYRIPASGEIATIDLNTMQAEVSENAQVTSAVTAQNNAAAKAIRETEEVRREQSSQTAVASKSASSNSTSSQSAKKSSGQTKAQSQSSSSSAKSVEKSSAPKESSSIPDRFWVQAGSYSNKAYADNARDVLDENKIQCEVFTVSAADGSLRYRVRVGPYTTKTEAEYWQKRIASIDLFKDVSSYITNSSAAAVAKK